MSVKVKDVLNLSIFKNNDTGVVAGKDGLNRIIRRVSVFDCPIGNDVVSKNIVGMGDFFVTSLFVVKNNLKEMIKLFEIIISAEASGICVINEFIHNFPKQIIQLANENSFPVFLIDSDIPYGDIIKDIMELIIKDKEDTINEMKIKEILVTDNYEKIIQTAYEINSNFMNNYIVFYLKNINDRSNIEYIVENINSKSKQSALKYENGVILVISDEDIAELKNKSNYIQDLINSTCSDYILGISDYQEHLKNFKKAIIQATRSCSLTSILDKKVVNYNELGVYSILLPLKNSVELNEFYNNIVLPIKMYDEKLNINLLETAVTFIDNDGNYKNVSQIMHQHENTIRYRIFKIKELLNMVNKEIDFYAQLYLMAKIYKIIT